LRIFDTAQKPEGRFILRVYRKGRLIEVVDEPNLIVTGASQNIAQLVGGQFTGNNVTQIGFGTNGTAPVVGNTGLTAPYYKALDSITFPASGEASFNFSLSSTQDNGVAIFEFGLFTAAGGLFARKVRSAALNWIVTF
jgi:hypothetical protein